MKCSDDIEKFEKAKSQAILVQYMSNEHEDIIDKFDKADVAISGKYLFCLFVIINRKVFHFQLFHML